MQKETLYCKSIKKGLICIYIFSLTVLLVYTKGPQYNGVQNKPHYPCVANKRGSIKQFIIVCYLEYLKLFHMYKRVGVGMINRLYKIYGNMYV